MSQSYDVTSPNNVIGVTVSAEVLFSNETTDRLVIRVYRNGNLAAVLTVAVGVDPANNAWFDTPITINNKTVNNYTGYNELIVNATDTEDNVTADIVIHVYDDAVILFIKNISSSQYHVQNYLLFIDDNDTVFIPSDTGVTNYYLETGLCYGKASECITSQIDLTKPIMINMTKKFMFTQLTLKYNILSAQLRHNFQTNIGMSRGIRLYTYPFPTVTPNVTPVSETDNVILLFFDDLEDIDDKLEQYVSKYDTVKEYDLPKLVVGCTWNTYKDQIDESNVKSLADTLSHIPLDGLIIDDGWQVGKSAVDVDTSKFPNGLTPVIQYIHDKNMRAGIHVYFSGIVSKGVDNSISTWKSWGLGSGDIIKVGFINRYIYETGDNYNAVQTLLSLLDKLYSEGFIVDLHEFRIYTLAYKYKNVVVESDPEAREANGTIYDVVVNSILKRVVNHRADYDLHRPVDNLFQTPFTTATSFARMFTHYMTETDLSEYDQLSNEEKEIIRQLITLAKKELATISLFDENKIIYESNNTKIITALQNGNYSVTVNNVVKVTTDQNNYPIGLTRTYIESGDTVSLKAEDSVIYYSVNFSIVGYPSRVSGYTGEQKTLNITVENKGSVDGTVELRIKDHNGNIVASQQQTIPANQSYTFNITITLPSQAGTYTWTIEAYNTDTGSVDDSKTFTVSVVEEGVPETDIMDTVMELFRMCIMAETMKSLRGREPDYTKCMNIYMMGVLISKLQQQQ